MTPAPLTNYEYLRQRWQERAPAQRRRWTVAISMVGLIWLLGAAYAFIGVAGIARLGPGARLLAALVMGPMGFLWAGLKGLGMIKETARTPSLLWLALAAVPAGGLWLVGKILSAEPNQMVLQRRKEQLHERAQGRLTVEEALRALRVEQGVLAAQLSTGHSRQAAVGIPYSGGEGHMLVVGPTRSGKGLHLTQTLLQWPGAALVVDPKAEQFARTAGYRQRVLGSPIYRLPGHRLHLAAYYDRLLDRDSLFELHSHLLRPWQSRERIFADKSRALFSAVAQYARARGLDPVRVLLDAADCDPVAVLKGLETVATAKQYVRLFTDGLPPESYQENRFATSAFGTFTTQLAGYQKHVDTIAPLQADEALVISPDWARRRATIYITYSLADLQGVGGVVAAVMAALMRGQLRRQRGQNHRRWSEPTGPDQGERVLVAVDELPSVGLYNVGDYLSTVGGYGITMLLYAQTTSQLRALYGPEGTDTLRGNCAWQVWYPPAEMGTARAMADLYGTSYMPTHSHSTSRRIYGGGPGDATRSVVDMRQGHGWEVRAALSPSEVMGLPQETVLVLGQRQYCFLAERLNPIPLLERLPPPPVLPAGRPVPRRYTAWEASGPGEARAAADEPEEKGSITNIALDELF